MLNIFLIFNIEPLFLLKRADLIVKLPKIHYLLENINNQNKKNNKNKYIFYKFTIKYIVHYNVLNIC